MNGKKVLNRNGFTDAQIAVMTAAQLDANGITFETESNVTIFTQEDYENSKKTKVAIADLKGVNTMPFSPIPVKTHKKDVRNWNVYTPSELGSKQAWFPLCDIVDEGIYVIGQGYTDKQVFINDGQIKIAV